MLAEEGVSDLSSYRYGDAALWRTWMLLLLEAWRNDPDVDLLHAGLHDLPRGGLGLFNVAIVCVAIEQPC